MPNFFKGRKRKGSKGTTSVPSQNVTPSTSTLTSTEQSDLHIERIDWVLEIAGIVKDISEGSPLLAPVKATCALIIRGLELTRVWLRFLLCSTRLTLPYRKCTKLDLIFEKYPNC
jgi:hypothetical protein